MNLTLRFGKVSYRSSKNGARTRSSGRESTITRTDEKYGLPVLVSRAARASTDARDFERFAGRSAMIGCVAAATMEVLDSLRGHVAYVDATKYSGTDLEGVSVVVKLCLFACLLGSGTAALVSKVSRNEDLRDMRTNPTSQDIAEAATTALKALSNRG